jgi:hypothetical protein
MQREDDMTENDRTLGRRAVDSALLLRWIPFLSLIVLMVTQTIYFTRYISGLELSNTQLVSTVSKLEAKMEQLAAGMAQGAIPNAEMALQIRYFDTRLNELRAMANDNSRRITQLEAGRGIR